MCDIAGERRMIVGEGRLGRIVDGTPTRRGQE
jgi:hypothetical protein